MAGHGARIRAARAYAHMSQGGLAEKLGVEVQWVKRRESDRQDAKRYELIAVAAVTGVTLAFLENGTGLSSPNEAEEHPGPRGTLGQDAVDADPTLRDQRRNGSPPAEGSSEGTGG
jgi:transcriptional regulator with XRE-family HTH domain